MDFYEVSRVVNVGMAGVLLVLTLVKCKRIWAGADLAQRLRYISFGFFSVSALYGGVFALVNHLPGGFQVTFLSGALALGVVSFLVPDKQANWMMGAQKYIDRN